MVRDRRPLTRAFQPIPTRHPPPGRPPDPGPATAQLLPGVPPTSRIRPICTSSQAVEEQAPLPFLHHPLRNASPRRNDVEVRRPGEEHHPLAGRVVPATNDLEPEQVLH